MRSDRIALAAASAAVTGVVVLAATLSYGQTERTDYYRPDGSRSTYTLTNPSTGWTEAYDAKTSKRLGGWKTSESALKTDGKRVPGGAPELVPKGKGGKR